MTELRNPRLIYLKGGLFLLGGCFACAVLLTEHPSWKVALLLSIGIWCFCRAYYFAFYVIQHYVDPGYKFAGLGSFLQYLWSQQRPGGNFPVAESVPPARRA